ncbi:MAG: TetR/AcrR family transcriptional regulator [Firmicutes bacterium]|nr:TetR/AcrR family transcriptional regulator [Bacillota bacterium]
MGKKAEYKSAIRSRRMIRQAFLELMREKELGKITVTDVVTRADLNRGTFYSHYQDIRAVIEQIENEIIDNMLELLGDFHYNKFFDDPLPLLLKVSRNIEKDLEFYRVLINSSGSQQFLIKLENVFIEYMKNNSDIPEHIKRTPEFIIRAHFFAGGIINLYQVWFCGQIDNSLSELSLVISQFITTNAKLFME